MKRPGLLIAAFAVALLGWVTLNSVATETAGSQGLQAGDALPPFAMPLSTSPCQGRCDANIATKPDQGAAGAKPACQVRGPQVLNSCELAEGGPFVLAFVFGPVQRCRDQLPVLAADANHAMSDPLRRLLTALAGLALVALALLVVYRSWERAWVPLVPIALATGWSALVLWLLGVPLNPMSAALSALVIAISTEFSVLLSARYREERDAGLAPSDALAVTYASTGAAVLASGVTAIAGFAVLIASDVAMLRDFGLVTVIDLAVSLLGVLAVLPAVLVAAERRESRGLPRRRGGRAVAA